MKHVLLYLQKNVQTRLKVTVELMMAHHFVAGETSSHWHVSSRCFVMYSGRREQSLVSVHCTDLKETLALTAAQA